MTLPAEPRSVGVARRFVASTLARWDLQQVTDDAVLLTSEVVTNALLHAGSPDMLLRVVRTGPTVRVEVTDDSAVMPRLRAHSPLSGTGRGLALLDMAATRWGSEPAAHGKAVWFELDAASEADAGVPPHFSTG